MVLPEGMGPAVPGLRLAAADMTARRAQPEPVVRAALFAAVAARCRDLERGMLAEPVRTGRHLGLHRE